MSGKRIETLIRKFARGDFWEEIGDGELICQEESTEFRARNHRSKSRILGGGIYQLHPMTPLEGHILGMLWEDSKK